MFNILNKQYDFNVWYDVLLENEEMKRQKVFVILDRYRVPRLPDDFDLALKSEKGSLAKRMRSYYKKEESGIILPDTLLSEVADTCADNNLNKVRMNFTKDFWKVTAGWGDAGSCWFTNNCGAPDLVLDNGGFFAQFTEKGRKIGRAVALPAVDADGYCFFNFKYTTPCSLIGILKTFFDREYSVHSLRSVSKGYCRKVMYFDSQCYFFGEGTPSDWCIDEKAYQTELCRVCNKYKTVSKPCRFCGVEK